MNTCRILFIGDVVGLSGQAMFEKHIQKIRTDYKINTVVVNGENSAQNGKGITEKIAEFFKQNGADIITTGNHIWQQREIISYIASHHNLLRPANFPPKTPGVGYAIVDFHGFSVAVINLQGRIFMKEDLDCPFRTIDTLLTYLKQKTSIICIDFHAEATSEKIGLAHYVDGRVSAVVGTHTHVQTADERILSHGTAFITDLGMVGALNGMLGLKKEPIIESFITQMPTRFVVDTEPPFVMSGVWIEVDIQTGKAIHIERIRIIDNDLRM